VRDALIREARRLFPGRYTTGAKRLERALIGYLLSNWRWEQHLEVLPEDVVDGRHQLLHSILAANGGRVLGWRRVVDIWSVELFATNSLGNCNLAVALVGHVAESDQESPRS
jgi:hypothetical protein